MSAELILGKEVAKKLHEKIVADWKPFKEQGQRIGLASVRIGQDPAGDWYFKAQKKAAESFGFDFTPVILPESCSLQEAQDALATLSYENENVHGIILTLPYPPAIKIHDLLAHMNPKKDVEGILPESLGRIVLREERLLPPTALAALLCMEQVTPSLRGKIATIIGQSAIVGRPLQMLLGARGVSTIVCNTGTSTEQMEAFVGQSDIVIACCGVAERIQGHWLKEGAVVIDVGVNEKDGRMVGDVQFEDALKRAAFITPVPGGVGPVTTKVLMHNLFKAWQWQREL